MTAVTLRNGVAQQKQHGTVLYEMRRMHDVSGVSGIGKVADLAVFPTGKAVLAWCVTEVYSVTIYDSLDEVLKIHGHGGTTRLVQVCPEPRGQDRARGGRR